LIAIANSPFFGYKGRVRSVNEALLLLGLSTASHAIAGLILRQLFPASPSLVRFWDASAGIARLSGWLAQNCVGSTRLRADDAYTFGLFRDCGIAVLIRRFNDYPDILNKANSEKELSFTAVEEAKYPTNHAVIGCLLAQSWWLPEEICLAIRNHHDYQMLHDRGKPSGIPATTLNMIATTQLAEHLFQHHTGMSRTQEWSKAGACCLSWLGITEEELPQLYQESQSVLN
jgi:HD-like signal output (HDOD) protein